ncbi:MAG: hypothetical protein ACLQHF_08800 [Terracidiphilus sp.]
MDSTLSLAGTVLEAVVVALLFYRRAWKNLPCFCAYSAWSLLDGCVDYLVLYYAPSAYFNTYFVGNIIDSVLQFCVLVELAWSVFRPFRASLPKHTAWFLAGLIALTGGVIWPFAKNPAFAHIPAPWRTQWDFLGHLMQTDSLLRVLFFLILAGCSQLLSIGWRDRELQIATGLGFYSLVAVVVAALQSYVGALNHYRDLDLLRAASYLGSLAYWAFSFAQKEAVRREFSPQMQGLLLAVAGAARSSRIALTGSSSSKSRTRRDL